MGAAMLTAKKHSVLPLNAVLKRLKRFGIAHKSLKDNYITIEGIRLESKTNARYVIDAYRIDREINEVLLNSILRRFEISEQDFFTDEVH